MPEAAASPRVFCIGRNYAEHARELGNEAPAAPVVFMKPWTSLVPPGTDIRFPAHGRELHHEVELVLRIGTGGRGIPPGDALRHVDGVAVGVDLTLRDLQGELKKQGLPWEAAKAFDQSAPLGGFHVPGDLAGGGHRFWCEVNGQRRQDGDSRDMVFDCAALVAALSRVWTLMPGDLVFTGTPPGVGPLVPGDELVVGGDGLGRYAWRIVA